MALAFSSTYEYPASWKNHKHCRSKCLNFTISSFMHIIAQTSRVHVHACYVILEFRLNIFVKGYKFVEICKTHENLVLETQLTSQARTAVVVLPTPGGPDKRAARSPPPSPCPELPHPPPPPFLPPPPPPPFPFDFEWFFSQSSSHLEKFVGQQQNLNESSIRTHYQDNQLLPASLCVCSFNQDT